MNIHGFSTDTDPDPRIWISDQRNDVIAPRPGFDTVALDRAKTSRQWMNPIRDAVLGFVFAFEQFPVVNMEGSTMGSKRRSWVSRFEAPLAFLYVYPSLVWTSWTESRGYTPFLTLWCHIAKPVEDPAARLS